jgi:putative tryptophan/tyrosine transport system substrate-binding protein
MRKKPLTPYLVCPRGRRCEAIPQRRLPELGKALPASRRTGGLPGPAAPAVRAPRDLEPAFAEITAAGADALIVFAHTLTIANSRSIIALANRQRFPTMYGLREYALEGGLIAYGPRITDSFRRAAYYVDRILKGAKPGDIPIEQPTKFELVVNLKTASAMGLAIPPALLARADEVIE